MGSWAHNFRTLAPEQELNGVIPQQSSGLHPSFPAWNAGSTVKGTGAGLYIDTAVLSGASLIFDNPILHPGLDASGEFRFVGDPLVGDDAFGDNRPSGRWFEQSIVNQPRQIQFSVMATTDEGVLGVWVAYNPGTGIVYEWTTGAVPSPNVEAINRLTWTYDAATFTVTARTSYDTISHVLSAGAQARLTAAEPPAGLHISGVSIIRGGGPTVQIVDASVNDQIRWTRAYPRDDDLGISLSGGRVYAAAARGQPTSVQRTYRGHNRSTRSGYE